MRAKRWASRTLQVPCASTMIPTSDPSVSRTSRTRAAESSTLLSCSPTRSFTARWPRSTYWVICLPMAPTGAQPPLA